MPTEFQVDKKRRMVFSQATGVINRIEALDHMDRLTQHPDFEPTFNQLWDFRAITTVDLSSGDVRELASRTIFSDSSKRAFVVSGDLQFGLCRMFGIYRELAGETGIVVFRDMNAARCWLSLSAALGTE